MARGFPPLFNETRFLDAPPENGPAPSREIEPL